MPGTFRVCQQSCCALAKKYRPLVKCHQPGIKNLQVDENGFVKEDVAREMLNNAIKLAQNGDACDALICYKTLVDSFDSTEQTATQEIVMGARFNYQMLKKLITP